MGPLGQGIKEFEKAWYDYCFCGLKVLDTIGHLGDTPWDTTTKYIFSINKISINCKIFLQEWYNMYRLKNLFSVWFACWSLQQAIKNPGTRGQLIHRLGKQNEKK